MVRVHGTSNVIAFPAQRSAAGGSLGEIVAQLTTSTMAAKEYIADCRAQAEAVQAGTRAFGDDVTDLVTLIAQLRTALDGLSDLPQRGYALAMAAAR